VLMYADAAAGPADVDDYERAADAAIGVAGDGLTVYLVAAPDADVATTVLPLLRDAGSGFAAAYPVDGRTAFVIRPDGYLGFVGVHTDVDGLVAHLRTTFG